MVGIAGWTRLRSVYLGVHAIAGYVLLIYYARELELSRWPEVVVLSLLVFSALFCEFPVPRTQSSVAVVYPVYILGIFMLGPLFIYPGFLGFIMNYLRRKNRRVDRLPFSLVTLWSFIRMAPIFLAASFLYEKAGGGTFHHIHEVPWGAFVVLLSSMCVLDLLSTNLFLALSEGKPPWTRMLSFTDCFLDVPLMPLAIPAFLLYQEEGLKSLILFSVPVVGGTWLVKEWFLEKSKRREFEELLTVANQLFGFSSPLEQTLESITHGVRRLLSADGIECFVGRRPGAWKLERSFGVSPWNQTRPPEEFVAALACLVGNGPALFSDVRNHPRFAPYKQAGLHSLILVPIEAEECTVCFVCSKMIASYFFRDHLSLAALLAGQLKAAVRGAVLREQLVSALSELQKAHQLKNQFLANISHELRNPLSAITGATHLLLDGLRDPLTQAQEREVHKVSRWSRLLFKLIDDLLDLSKIQAGKMTLTPTVVRLEALLGEVTATLEPQAREKGLFFELTVPVPLPPVYADPDRTVQVLMNLVGNAVKFTREGTIRITATQIPPYVAVGISDTGAGIPQEEIPRIFEEFHQINGTSSRSKGGAGLGLTIAKHLVELQGGTLRVESVRGRGSTFTFTIPVAVEALGLEEPTPRTYSPARAPTG